MALIDELNDEIDEQESGNVGDGAYTAEILRKAKAEIARLQAIVDDYENSIKHAIDERHDDNTQHCACVPLLRVEVKRLQQENTRLREDGECLGDECPEIAWLQKIISELGEYSSLLLGGQDKAAFEGLVNVAKRKE